MGLDELPRYIRYDFFMALLGLLMFYFSFSNDKVYEDFFFHWILIIVGIICFMYGFFQMKKNYLREQELEQMRDDAEKLELKEQIKDSQVIKSKGRDYNDKEYLK